MRKVKFATNEYYHIYNRGNDKKLIFLDDNDYARFLFLTLYFQGDYPFYNIGRYVLHLVKHRVFNMEEKMLCKILEKRIVELVEFSLMPTHFHFLLHECVDTGISRYMQRVLNAYTKYFNAKYNRSGHLFQGPFNAVYVETNEQLLHLSAYIHRNPRELEEWKGKEHIYFWSSYQDYVGRNRWRELLKCEKILVQFKDLKEYQNFVDSSGVKEKELEVGLL